MSRSGDGGSRGFGLLLVAILLSIGVFYLFLVLVRAVFDIPVPILGMVGMAKSGVILTVL